MASFLPKGPLQTIERHILEQQKFYPEATGTLTGLLYDLALAGKIISSHIQRAGLAEIFGPPGAVFYTHLTLRTTVLV